MEETEEEGGGIVALSFEDCITKPLRNSKSSVLLVPLLEKSPPVDTTSGESWQNVRYFLRNTALLLEKSTGLDLLIERKTVREEREG